MYSLENKTQKLFYPSENCDSITSLAIPPTRRVIAICEYSRKGVIVSLLDFPSLKRRKPLVASENSNHPFLYSAFSSDSKYFAVQEGAPTWNLYVFNWEKNKLIGSTQSVVEHGKTTNFIRFHPTDPSILVTAGFGTLNFFRVTDGLIKSLPLNTYKKELGNILCHTFVTDKRCIVCTDNGELILFENTGSCIELKVYIPVSPTEISPIYSITPIAKGFIAGTRENTIRIYEESDDSAEYYHMYKQIRAKTGNDIIKAVTTSPSDDLIIASTNNCQVFSFSMSKIELVKTEDAKLDVTLGPFHSPNNVY